MSNEQSVHMTCRCASIRLKGGSIVAAGNAGNALGVSRKEFPRPERASHGRREALRVLARPEIVVRLQKIWSREEKFCSRNQKNGSR